MVSATWNRFFGPVFQSLGRRVVEPVAGILELFLMCYVALRSAFYDQAQGLRSVMAVVSAQIYFTGWQALPLISMLALASGTIVVMQASTGLSLLGGSNMLGNLMVMIVVRELAPLLTALIVIARSGTAVASEIGNMRVNREIEALEVLGINPMSYIMFPRLVGGVVSVVCLAIYFVMISIFGGFLINHFFTGIAFSFYADGIAAAFSKWDMGLFLLKNIFSGAIIFSVSCRQGFLVQNAPHEVPQVTTRAVVDSVIHVVGFNLAVTTLFYLGTMMSLGVL